MLRAVLLSLSVMFAGSALAQTTLNVYSAMEPDEVKTWTARFTADNPDINLNVIRGSTGIMWARILAEKDKPQADVIWRIANLALINFGEMGMLEPYTPKDATTIDAVYVDKKRPMQWVGHSGYFAAMCFNTVEAQKKNVPQPTSWRDLAKPVYKGLIVMPNPSSSGTGFIMVSSWIQLFGEAEAWKFMDALHENVGQYVHSGSRPCQLAATGEFTVGLSFSYRGSKLKTSGAPIELIFAREGAGWDLEGSAILKGTKNLPAAKRFMDWVASANAMKLYSEEYAIVSRPTFAKPAPFHPADISKVLIKNDFDWAAANRDRILTEWMRRYDSKSAPKT